MPSWCPHCGGEVELERTGEQFQLELSEMTLVMRKFRIRVSGANRTWRAAVAQGRVVSVLATASREGLHAVELSVSSAGRDSLAKHRRGSKPGPAQAVGHLS